MKTNRKITSNRKTHQGAVAKNISVAQELRRSVMTCMLWENSFYENGVSIADRIKDLVSRVSGETARDIAIEAREQMKLRHAPLYIAVCMARLPEHRPFVRETLFKIIQRPDELAEYLKLYWSNGKCPIAKQVKLGLADAFGKFDEYQLAKWSK